MHLVLENLVLISKGLTSFKFLYYLFRDIRRGLVFKSPVLGKVPGPPGYRGGLQLEMEMAVPPSP